MNDVLELGTNHIVMTITFTWIYSFAARVKQLHAAASARVSNMFKILIENLGHCTKNTYARALVT